MTLLSPKDLTAYDWSNIQKAVEEYGAKQHLEYLNSSGHDGCNQFIEDAVYWERLNQWTRFISNIKEEQENEGMDKVHTLE